MKTKKKTLKQGVQKSLTFIIGVWISWICLTIDTIDKPIKEIKCYIVFTCILSLMAFISIYLLTKYSNIFDIMD